MDLSLNARELEIQQRSRTLCDDVLLPLEIPCDEQDGLSPAELKDAYQAIIDAKLNAVNMREDWGGQGLSLFEQVLSQEQLGRSTNALWDIVWRPANVLKYCTPEQRERFLILQTG
jgi:alkylation response protein AidB-like acyl-CoA dehydrogenase